MDQARVVRAVDCAGTGMHRAVVVRAAMDAGMVGAAVVTCDEAVASMVDAAVVSETEVASKVNAEE